MNEVKPSNQPVRDFPLAVPKPIRKAGGGDQMSEQQCIEGGKRLVISRKSRERLERLDDSGAKLILNILQSVEADAQNPDRAIRGDWGHQHSNWGKAL